MNNNCRILANEKDLTNLTDYFKFRFYQSLYKSAWILSSPLFAYDYIRNENLRLKTKIELTVKT